MEKYRFLFKSKLICINILFIFLSLKQIFSFTLHWLSSYLFKKIKRKLTSEKTTGSLKLKSKWVFVVKFPYFLNFVITSRTSALVGYHECSRFECSGTNIKFYEEFTNIELLRVIFIFTFIITLKFELGYYFFYKCLIVEGSLLELLYIYSKYSIVSSRLFNVSFIMFLFHFNWVRCYR